MAKRKGFEAACNMPRLKHTLPGVKFDIMNSEVAKWLVQQPSIRQTLFDLVREQGLIVYDPQTGTWEGACRKK